MAHDDLHGKERMKIIMDLIVYSQSRNINIMIPKTNKITLLLGQIPLALLTWDEAQAQNTEEAYAVWWVLASAI